MISLALPFINYHILVTALVSYIIHVCSVSTLLINVVLSFLAHACKSALQQAPDVYFIEQNYGSF